MFGIPITTIKAIVFFALGFALGNVLVPHNAFAYTYDRTPTGNVSSQQFTLTLNSTGLNELCPTMPFPPFDQPATAYKIAPTYDDDGIYPNAYLYSSEFSGNSAVYTVTSTELADIQNVIVGCNYGGGTDFFNIQTLEAGVLGAEIVFTILPQTSGGNGGGNLVPDFDLWGDNSGTDMAATVVTGVQETTQTALPFLGFVGISLAFIILLQFMVFTKRTIAPVQTGKKTTTPDEYTKDHPDYKAYKRGRKIIEKEHPEFYD